MKRHVCELGLKINSVHVSRCCEERAMQETISVMPTVIPTSISHGSYTLETCELRWTEGCLMRTVDGCNCR
jgi:hypothetical protein